MLYVHCMFWEVLPMEHTISCKHIKPLCLCSSKDETWINHNLYIMNYYYYYFDVFVLLGNVKITMISKQHNNVALFISSQIRHFILKLGFIWYVYFYMFPSPTLFLCFFFSFLFFLFLFFCYTLIYSSINFSITHSEASKYFEFVLNCAHQIRMWVLI